MYRYKLMVKRFFGIKSPLEKSIEQKLEAMTNEGMIGMMSHQFDRYKRVTHFTLPKAIWASWIRR